MVGKSILVVDDDSQIREVFSRMLEILGHRYQCAEDGLAAYDVLKNTPFDMVLCDIRMPEMDGLELMKQIQRMDMDVPFIMVTGFGDEFTYDLVVKSGARDFIKKPFTIEELENKLNRVFKELRVSEENRNLLEKQIQLNKRLSALLAIAGELCSELDFDRLFHLIINRVTEALDAQRTSLYIIDKKNGEIWTKVAQQIEEIRVPLGSGISGRVAESGEPRNRRMPGSWIILTGNTTSRIISAPIRSLHAHNQSFRRKHRRHSGH